MHAQALHPALWSHLNAYGDRLPHALLLTGQAGIGKLALAESFAARLLCESPIEQSACGECESCHWFSQGNHPDYRRVVPDADGTEAEGVAATTDDGGGKRSERIRIEQIRALEDFFHVGTHRSGYRVCLLSPAEAMNVFAANSLLKILEEPSPSTCFILISNSPDGLLPTIRSRCQRLAVSRPDRAKAIDWLLSKGHGKDEAEELLDLAAGAPLLAAQLALPEQKALEALLREAMDGEADAYALASKLEKLVKTAARPAAFLENIVNGLQKWLIDARMLLAGERVVYHSAELPLLQRFAARHSAASLDSLLQHMATVRRRTGGNLNTRLFLEGLLAQLDCTTAKQKSRRFGD